MNKNVNEELLLQFFLGGGLDNYYIYSITLLTSKYNFTYTYYIEKCSHFIYIFTNRLILLFSKVVFS